MNTVFILMINLNMTISLNHTMNREMPVKAYSTYSRCTQAAKFYTDEEKTIGISYYCIEMELLK